MNIIISSPTSYKLTEVPNEITNKPPSSMENTKIYIINDLVATQGENLEEIITESINATFTNTTSSLTYECLFIYTPELDKTTLMLRGYSIKAKESCIPAGTYNCTFTLGSSTINLENIKFTSGLVDEHAPVYVRNRRIGEITTPIIAGDKRSQQIVFYIQKCYDGISFLDNSKQVWVKYIPLLQTGSEQIHSCKAEIYDIYPDPDLDGIDWVKVVWNVPDEVMNADGEIRFAIVITNKLGGGETTYEYIWQTFPSTLTIYEGLGAFPELPIEEEDMDSVATILTNKIIELESDVARLESMDLDNNSENEEFILGGGGADEFFDEPEGE